jgi:hypothetical protein
LLRRLRREEPKPETSPLVTDEADALARIRSWIVSEGPERLRKEIRFVELDKELGFAPGVTAKLIVTAASARYDVDHQSSASILFKSKPHR